MPSQFSIVVLAHPPFQEKSQYTNMGNDEKQSSHVFIKDKEFGWRPAVQEKVNGDTAIVTVHQYANEQAMQCDGGRSAKGKGERMEIKLKDYPNNVLPLQNVDANGTLIEFPDMVKLPYLHEVSCQPHFNAFSFAYVHSLV